MMDEGSLNGADLTDTNGLQWLPSSKWSRNSLVNHRIIATLTSSNVDIIHILGRLAKSTPRLISSSFFSDPSNSHQFWYWEGSTMSVAAIATAPAAAPIVATSPVIVRFDTVISYP
jgi:hypothetical protein